MANKQRTKKRPADHGTFLKRGLMSCDAWKAISPKAQMIYIWLRLEWKGSQFNNNGKIRLSYRQTANRLGICTNAAMGGFHELQAKGFILVTTLGALGVEGLARSPTYELTDIGLPNGRPKNLFLKWKNGSDYPVVRHQSRSKSKSETR